ncbi:MAG: flavin reductase family protein [Pseudomonadota bacterium]
MSELAAPEAMPFDTRAFRTCLGQFPTGVCVVTTDVESQLVGMTISSFNSVSLDPPLILFSITRSSRSLPLWQRASAYAVNVLSENQQNLSNRFSRQSPDKWEGITFSRGFAGAPVLPGTAAALECSTYAQHDAGDHVLFIARVERFIAQPSRSPLVFCKGSYGTLKKSGESADLWPLDIHY